VSRAAPDVVGLPFRGAGWVATDSANANGTHRRTMIPKRDANGAAIPGEFYTPERFAIDWVMADATGVAPSGRTTATRAISRGASKSSRSPTASSRASSTKCRKTASEEPAERDRRNRRRQLRHAGHRQRTSRVLRTPATGQHSRQEGDRVTRGQIIGLLGNSGNSSEPHLHFQISDRASPLQSQGLPYVFDRYELTGRADVLGETTGRFEDFIAQPASPKFSLMPAAEQVVNADVTAAEPAAWAFPPRYPAQ
jgi:hypothetical protein